MSLFFKITLFVFHSHYTVYKPLNN